MNPFGRRPHSYAIALLSLALHCSGSPGSRAPTPAVTLANEKMSVKVETQPFGLTVTNAAGVVLLSTVGARAGSYAGFGATHRSVAFRAHILEGFDYQDQTDAPFAHLDHVAVVAATGTTASLDLDGNGVRAHLDLKLDGAELRLDARVDGPGAPLDGDQALPGINLATMAFDLDKEEHFFGLGERLVTVDHRGRTYESWVEEGGIGQGEASAPGPNNPAPNGPQMSHAPIPFFLSSRGYALWQDTGFRTGTSFGAERPDAWRLYAAEPALHVSIFVHDAPADSIADFTRKTGRASLPAPWVFGPRRRMDTNAMVQGVPEMELLRTRHVPTTAADDATHFLPIGSQVGREAELKDWVGRLHRWGFKAIGYYNAYVSVTDARAAADAQKARAAGYFLKMEDGSEANAFMISAGPQTVATIDMTNPDAVTWYGTILQRALDLGYDGWMLDFGEYVPPHAKTFDGRLGWEEHNLFPTQYQKAAWDYMKRVRGDDFMYFARAGYTGTQAFIPVHWSGDPSASFDDAKGLPAQVRAGVNAGLSGIPFWGSDIGGYTCLNDPPGDKEVYLRWVEFGALSSDMHHENACSGTGQKKKWELWDDDETVQVYGDYARLHTRLFPYLYAAAKEAVTSGIPVMRHPFLAHSREARAYGVDLEYYFGPSLYVAPVVRRGQTVRSFWMPPGTWVDWWTLDKVDGGKDVERAAPLTVLPLYLKSGGIVPMLDPTIETLAPATEPSIVTMDKVSGVLDVRAAIDPRTARATATLVDGTTFEVTANGGPAALPAGVAQVDESMLATCSSCGRLDPLANGVRVRVNGELAATGQLAAGGLLVRHAGGPARRMRWDVVVLP